MDSHDRVRRILIILAIVLVSARMLMASAAAAPWVGSSGLLVRSTGFYAVFTGTVLDAALVIFGVALLVRPRRHRGAFWLFPVMIIAHIFSTSGGTFFFVSALAREGARVFLLRSIGVVLLVLAAAMFFVLPRRVEQSPDADSRGV